MMAYEVSQNPFYSSRSHFNTAPQGQLVSLEGVGLTFGTKKALEGLHLSLVEGEMLFVTGASGAGKTSLLRLFSGELSPTTGKVFIPEGKSLRVARVFQGLCLLENETILDNLKWVYQPDFHKSFQTYQEELQELSEFFQFGAQLKEKVKNLNGGLKQKVALVRALLSNPRLLILDEPTAHLDSHNAQKVFEVVRFYNAKKATTIIWASHDRELVRKFNGRIVHLEHGRLAYSGQACFI